MEELESVSLEEFLRALAEEEGVDLRVYKHTTLERRLRRRMAQVGVVRHDEYLDLVRREPSEKKRLLETVLINVTEFFRDPQAWEVIAREVLPALLRHRRPGDTFRAWVAGCASGEEAYSLAILLAEHLGPELPRYDIKIYATDVDEDALTTARQGQYHSDRLRRVPPEWRARYFTGQTVLRVARDIRRMVIFGRSDLVHDAPISHVLMAICRNVLIYFNADAQQRVLARLHYALEPGGVLFLGKAESKLTDSILFAPIHPRWRLFRRAGALDAVSNPFRTEELMRRPGEPSGEGRELSLLKLYHRTVLEALDPGIVMLDPNHVVLSENDSARRLLGLGSTTAVGRPLHETALATRCPELLARVEESILRPDRFRLQCRIPIGNEPKAIGVTIHPVVDDAGERVGTLLYVEDVSQRERLQQTVEQLESTSEELQSANEELETTNEELQSTNEELETTNEELQSTNEELETTNEELQSLNEELENMNEELEVRTRELDLLMSRYASTLEQMPWGVALVGGNGRIQFWNSAAQTLFGLEAASIVGLEIGQLPVETSFRQMLVRSYGSVLGRGQAVVTEQPIESDGATVTLQVHVTPVGRDGPTGGVLIMFSPVNTRRPGGPQIAKNTPRRDKTDGAPPKTATKSAARKTPSNSPSEANDE